MDHTPTGADTSIEERRAWVDKQREAQSAASRPRLFIRAASGRRGRVLAHHGDAWADRSPSSRAIHRLGEITSSAAAGVAVGLALAGWVVVGIATGFPTWWQAVLYATGTSVTLVMVFAIQHTQTRQEIAIQRKLDELLRAVPRADNRLIAAEDAPDAELDALAQLNLIDRLTDGDEANKDRAR
jgi:low affinity Fe/Cu permease